MFVVYSATLPVSLPVASNGTMMDEWRIGKNLVGIDRGLIEVLNSNLHEGTEENGEKPQPGNPVPC
jgi:hypothetical protein